ncbi:MAG: hypothetical protein ACYTET_07225, partial [Planctomycetota bacterium]
PVIPTTVAVLATIIFLTILFAGGAIGFIYLDQFVQRTTQTETPYGSLLITKPAWVEQPWIDKMVDVAGGSLLPLQKDTAETVTMKLETLSWLDNVVVQTTPKHVTVKADYRKPVGLIKPTRNRQYYLDVDAVVLDYIPVTTLPVIEIKGVAATGTIPDPGYAWAAEDAQAAVILLDLLATMDANFIKQDKMDKPLLDEIVSVDVSNFAARKSRSKPHIILNVNDGTIVNWGAACFEESRYLEANIKEKLADLYQHFMDHNNSLQGSAKYIELRHPEDGIPRPQ